MLAIIGIVVIFAMVFGGYLASGGSLKVIIKALPFELMMIGGAALGAFLVSNNGTVAKGTLKGVVQVFKGNKWKKQDYIDLLCLLFELLKLIKTKGMMAVEPHIEDAHNSDIFSKYPKIQHDHFACDFIADTLRMVTMNMDNPYQVEDAMQKQLDKHHHEVHAVTAAIQSVADALPALGIVAAVLGVIKTMSAITEPPEILGKMIGGALVGTFLGVFLAYGFVGPFSAKLGQVTEEDGQFYMIIRDILVAHLHNNPPQISVEIGRGNIPTHMQPSFAEMEDAQGNI